ncbi:MAG: hypothetical protein COW30_18765 [Rhodospirillales bacterium CG15_BIG_FIL_POST_REV_8_21_14_020_66_15]|nr:MAG: hypothetical protein COW30_18765 [Rhodospirillales bacterium CG15_BIG_FIL_POST_REV_8_21_14_020_66_15]
MERIIFTIDALTAWAGKAFSWTILLLTFGVAYEVFVRYVLRNPTSWAFDVSYMMYGTLFMMAGAYALSRESHVRGDVIYRLWKPRTQAIVEMTLYILFFYPGILALIFAGADYAAESWSYNGGRGEVSVMSPANIPIFQFKIIIPVAAGLLFIQGIAQILRCIVCLRTGQWPAHLEDVEEMETILLQQHEEQEKRGQTAA